MKFVKDQGCDAIKHRVGLDHPGQDAFGHHLDPGGGGYGGVPAHPVADGFAHGFAKAFRHAFCGTARSKAAGFKHQDAAMGQAQRVCMGQHIQRHPRGFAGPRWRLQNGHARAGQGVAQGGQGIVDGQGAVAVHGGLIAGLGFSCHMVCVTFPMERG